MEPSLRQEARRRATARSFVAQTRFRGCIVVSPWPRDAVERVLPPGVRLAGERATARARHPVLFVFGEHDDSAVLFASLRLATGATFPEVVVAVPFVEHDNGGVGMFVRRVFSAEPVATWSGNVHYGFTKSMVTMEWFGNSFVVTDEPGSLLLHATAEPAGPWEGAASSGLPGFDSAVALGRLPVLGCRADGTWVTSHFEWAFADARVRPLRAVVSIDAPLGPGLGPRVCHAAAGEAFEVQGMRWRLSWPETRPGTRYVFTGEDAPA